MNQRINDEAVYRTAPATPGLLIIFSLGSPVLPCLFDLTLQFPNSATNGTQRTQMAKD